MDRRIVVKIPSDALASVFTAEVLAKLRRACRDSEELQFRLEVLTACGPYPSDPRKAERLRLRRARKAAWEAYVGAAYACGLLGGPRHDEIAGRLTSTNEEDFRSAMAECLACWFFTAKLGLAVRPADSVSSGKVPDLLVVLDSQKIHVEVKAPFRKWTLEPFRGGETDILQHRVEDAKQQLPEGGPNIVFLVPRLRGSICDFRYDLTHAVLGEHMIEVPINVETGDPAGPPRDTFQPRGLFLKLWGRKRSPHYTRVSAVVCLEDDEIASSNQVDPRAPCIVIHNAIIVHNPYATVLVPRTIWGDYPQLVCEEDTLFWTDGEPIV